MAGGCIIRIQLDRRFNQRCAICRSTIDDHCVGQFDHFGIAKLQLVGVDNNGVVDLIATLVVISTLFQQGSVVFHCSISFGIAYALPLCEVGEHLVLGSKARYPVALIHLDRIADVESVDFTCAWIVEILKPVF